MPSLLSLPNEILDHICSLLHPFDVEAVARTLNHRLYDVAGPILVRHSEWVNNARKMIALFPVSSDGRQFPSFPGYLDAFDGNWGANPSEELPRSLLRQLGMDPLKGPFIRSSPPDLRSWMRLDGTFGWLEPLDEKMAAIMKVYNGPEGLRPVAPKEDIDQLVSDVSDHGLVLPTGFETFLRSSRYHHRIPSASAWYFQLSPLIKAPASIDKGAGGYMVRFYFDQQSCAFAYLYLTAGGGHCVLVSGEDVYYRDDDEEDEDENDDEDKGSFDANDFNLQGLTFEEYLVSVYFQELLYFAAAPFQGLKDYVRHVYRSPTEVEHLRELNPTIKSFLDIQKWQGSAHYVKSISDDDPTVKPKTDAEESDTD